MWRNSLRPGPIRIRQLNGTGLLSDGGDVSLFAERHAKNSAHCSWRYTFSLLESRRRENAAVLEGIGFSGV
jgi:hypothetical protein